MSNLNQNYEKKTDIRTIVEYDKFKLTFYFYKYEAIFLKSVEVLLFEEALQTSYCMRNSALNKEYT